MFLKRNTIALVVILTVTVITMIRLHMLIHILTLRRGLTFMVYLIVPLGNITLFDLILLQQVLPPLLSHLLVCGWLRRTNSSPGLCLRWIRMGHGQWLHKSYDWRQGVIRRRKTFSIFSEVHYLR